MFDVINSILYDKKSWETFTLPQQNSFTIFTLNKALSNISEYIGSVNVINEYSTSLTNEQVYNFYKDLFPKKRIYVKYVKKTQFPYTKELLEFFSKRLKESKKNIEFMLTMFSRDDVEDYLIQCGLEDKEIKSLLKIFRK
jgi:hypothetical protein